MSVVLVSGAAGFIGSHICQRLLKSGRTVVGIDNFNDYYPAAIKRFHLSFLQNHPRFKFYRADILDAKKMSAIFSSHPITAVVHCGARAGVRASVANPLIYTQTNVEGTQVLLECLRHSKRKIKTVLLSSSSVYGLQDQLPFHEEMVPNPQSPYGASKYAMELIARQYDVFYGLPIAVVRPFSIYGPRGRVDMAPFLTIRAAEEGKIFTQYGSNADNQRDWTYVEDFAEGVCALLNRFDFKTFEIFNLGDRQPIGIEDFLQFAGKLSVKYLGKPLRLTVKPRGMEELPVTMADIGKAKRAFGYTPKVDFYQGLELFFAYYVQNRSLYQKALGLKKS